MHHPDSDLPEDGPHAALAHTFALVSAASAAVRVLKAVRDRRDGRDPSDQEAASDAADALNASVRELEALLIPVFVSSAVSADDSQSNQGVRLVRHFDRLHRAWEAASLLHRIHQRLLSLYPAVPETLVEEARVLQQDAAAAADCEVDEAPPHSGPLFERIHAFLVRLETFMGGIFSA